MSARALPEDKSDFLHMLRWLSALCVVVGHSVLYLEALVLKSPVEPDYIRYLGVHAHAAVMVFFVLSGFVISYTIDRRRSAGTYEFSHYMIDRWSRIYSVLLIALLLTIVLDVVGAYFSSTYIDPELLPQEHYALRLAANVFSLQGIQGHRIQFGSNPALWTVGYEFTFYILWGLIFFRRNVFRSPVLFVACISSIVFLIGWKMAYYFLIWLMGVLAYYVYRRGFISSFRLNKPAAFIFLICANHLVNYASPIDSELVRDMLFSFCVSCVLMLGMAECRWGTSITRPINRHMAEFSYSLYAYHTPVIFFISSVVFLGTKNYYGTETLMLMLVMSSLVTARIMYYISESRRHLLQKVGRFILSKTGGARVALD